nr:putative ribonuclease H-like domain-containing protein [Tanacetum cinerariifolium]
MQVVEMVLQQNSVRAAGAHGSGGAIFLELPCLQRYDLQQSLYSQACWRSTKPHLKDFFRTSFDADRFTLAMRKYGFKQCNSDHTLFLKRKGKLVTCLIIYVDDMIITGNDKEEMTRLRTNLFKEFKMKDLGRLKYFLGIEVLRSKQGIFIFQKKYVFDLLAETGMIDCKPVDTPMMVNQKLYIEEKAKLADKGRSCEPIHASTLNFLHESRIENHQIPQRNPRSWSSVQG